MRINATFLCLAAVLPSVLSSSIVPDSGTMRFSSLGVEEGMSHNKVSDISQDTLGTVWFATPDGLNRFDGIRIRTYRHSRGDSLSLQSNNIHKIWRDSRDVLWVCTSNGLARYDAIADNFHRIDIPGAVSVEFISELSDEELLVETRNASYSYDVRTDSVSLLKLDGKAFVFYSACRKGEDIILCTRARTVESLNFRGGELLRKYPPVQIPRFGLSVLPDISAEDSYWVGTKGGGLLRVNVRTGEWHRVDVGKDGWVEVPALEYDDDGRLWVGHNGGLTIFSGEDIVYKAGEEALNDRIVTSLYKDSSRGMWIGTGYGGADYWNPGRAKFSSLTLPSSGFRDKGEIVTCVNAMEDGSIWVGTRYDGLFLYDPGTGVASNFPINDVRTVQKGDDGQMFYAGGEVIGLHGIDPRSGAVKRFPTPPRDIMSIVPAGKGKLWLGTLVGLRLFDTLDGSVREVAMPPHKNRLIRILTLFRDKDDNLWVGAKESLRVFRVGDDYSLTNITPKPLESIVYTQCIHQSEDGRVWIGNVDGLIEFSRNEKGEGVIRHIGGVTAATVRGIEEDGDGYLWVSTDNGLNRYNPSTGENRLYNSDDGISCSLFNTCAHSHGSNGVLYFGGAYGVDFFEPENIATDSTAFKTLITDLIVNNAHITPGDESGLLQKNVTFTDKITLKHWQNSVTVNFACPDMISWDSCHYRYKLEGFDRDWTPARGTEATYTKLPAGKYTFLVQAANSDGVWYSTPTSLKIRIKPVWYKSRLMIVLYAILSIGIMAYVILRIIDKSVKDKEKEKQKEIEALKLRYEQDRQKSRIGMFVKDLYNLRPLDERFISAVLSDIEKNLGNKMYSVEALAGALCVSRGNLHLRVKAITGKTPVEIIRTLRMQRACTLLKDSDKSIAEIAEESGFDNSAYFTTVFKNTFGETPGRYRSRVKK